MEIKIEAPWKVKASQVELIKKKLTKLITFYDRLIKAEVFLKAKENTGTDDKVAVIKLLMPGPDLFAESCCSSHEKAIVECTEKLRRQILKRKGKLARRA